METDRQKYLTFATNRQRTERELLADYETLLEDPNLVSFGFLKTNPRIILLQTPIIQILYQGEFYEIGSLIIMVKRERSDRSWQIAYRFKNTNGICKKTPDSKGCHHPHILNTRDEENEHGFGDNVGTLCISEGHGMLERFLREGRIPEAYLEFLRILTAYPTGQPYLAVEDGWTFPGSLKHTRE